jgi:hypothetical protein
MSARSPQKPHNTISKRFPNDFQTISKSAGKSDLFRKAAGLPARLLRHRLALR